MCEKPGLNSSFQPMSSKLQRDISSISRRMLGRERMVASSGVGLWRGEVSTRQSNSRSTSLSCRHLLISALIKAGVVVFMGRQGSSVSCRRRRNCSPLQHPIPPSLSTHLIIVLHALCPSYCFFLPCLSLARVCQHLTPPAGTHTPGDIFFHV